MLAACTSPPTQEAGQDGNLSVVATTTIVGDVVKNIGGDAIKLSTMLPVQSDPHSFEPTPQDIARVAEADAIFANGAGLEEFLEPLIESAGAGDKVIDLSKGIQLIESTSNLERNNDDHHADPHVWTDPNNLILWTQVISETLSELDPANAEAYRANAAAYQEQLVALDAWIREQVALIPPENRKLVTDHLTLVYFANEYGFSQVGAIIPGYSTLAEPSAQELAALVDRIKELDVPAIFVGNTINPALADRLTEDTGTRLVFLYTGSLSESGGGADSYLAYMKYNISAIVNALK